MKTIRLSSASKSLAEYVAGLSDEIILLTERNRAVAAIVPLKGVDRAQRASGVLEDHRSLSRPVPSRPNDFVRGHESRVWGRAVAPKRANPKRRTWCSRSW